MIERIAKVDSWRIALAGWGTEGAKIPWCHAAIVFLCCMKIQGLNTKRLFYYSWFFLLLLFETGCMVKRPVSVTWHWHFDSAQKYLSQKKYDSALTQFRTAERLWPVDSISTERYAGLQEKMGASFTGLEIFDSALNRYALALDKLAASGDTIGDRSYSLFMEMGKVQNRKGTHENARNSFEQARNLSARIHSRESSRYAKACTFLANVLSATGKDTLSEELYKEAIHVYTQKLKNWSDSVDLAQAHNNLGALYLKKGRFEDAEPLIFSAYSIRSKRRDNAFAISCTNLANLYTKMGQYAKAESRYLEAKQIRETINTKESDVYAQSCNILADLYMITERYPEAIRLYQEALAIREKKLDSNHRDIAQTCNNLAETYASNNQFRQALPLALKANSIWRSKGDAEKLALAINANLLGDLYFGLGDFDSSRTYFEDCRNVLAEEFDADHPEFVRNTIGLARVAWQTGNTFLADSFYNIAIQTKYHLLEKVFRFTNETEKFEYMKNIAGTNDEYLSFFYKTGNRSGAGGLFDLSVRFRNLVLNSERNNREVLSRSNDSAVSRAFAELKGLRQQIASSWSRSPNLRGENSSDLPALQRRADSLEKALARKATSLEVSGSSTTWQDIREKLSTESAVVEFNSFRFFNGRHWTDSILYSALVLRKDGAAPELCPLFEKKTYDSLPGSVAGSGKSTRGIKVLSRAKRLPGLYKCIWLPLEKHLHGIRQVYYSPSGILYKVPFAALPFDSNHVLIERYRLLQLNSAASLLETDKTVLEPADRLLLMGGVNFGQSSSSDQMPCYPALPGTLEEVNLIQGMAGKGKMNTLLLLGDSASEYALKRDAEKYDPTLIHIATHGYYIPGNESRNVAAQSPIRYCKQDSFRNAGNPLYRSGLILAEGCSNGQEDGILTAYEVANLDLTRTRLVVLSGCETALGDVEVNEGVLGLQRSFKMAGARYLLMSLWPVPDSETSVFMQRFYRYLFTGKPVVDALSMTQREMSKLYKNDYLKWASWVIIK